MKSGLLFTLTIGGLSILFLLISSHFMKDLSVEITSYLFWFFIVCTIVGIMIFPFAVVLIRRMSVGRFSKCLIYLALGLVILNLPVGAQDNKWITIEAIKDLLHPRQGPLHYLLYEIGVFHILPLLALSLSLFLFRNRLFDLPAH